VSFSEGSQLCSWFELLLKTIRFNGLKLAARQPEGRFLFLWGGFETTVPTILSSAMLKGGPNLGVRIEGKY
jgi:hypothetical protein